MQHKFSQLKQDVEQTLAHLVDARALAALRAEVWGRKGRMALLMKELAALTAEEKKVVGQMANEVKQAMEAAFAAAQQRLGSPRESVHELLDVTQPSLPLIERGHLHPITQVQEDLEDLFTAMGFLVVDGPELESEFFNFTALNIPPEHPARDTQDTFYISDRPLEVLRTHTSPVQIRAMRRFGAPLRVIAPGRCFRNEATDVRHEHTFHHLEGLVIDRDINLGHLKGVLASVARHLYGEHTRLRLRPKFYPFVEPGVNGEVTCLLCAGKGCRLCKKSGWLEIFGAGLVHPAVLKQGGIDTKIYSGFAFGLGLTRLVMLKYGIDDIRRLASGEVRFLNQF